MPDLHPHSNCDRYGFENGDRHDYADSDQDRDSDGHHNLDANQYTGSAHQHPNINTDEDARSPNGDADEHPH